MTNAVRYWEYQLKIYDKIDNKKKIRSGVVAADTITEAMQKIENYGDIIIEIQMLKSITDGVFEFQHVTKDTDFDFDFVISKKI